MVDQKKTSTNRRKKARGDAELLDLMVDHALALAEQLGWSGLTLKQIREAAGIAADGPEAEQAYVLCPGKQAILDAYHRRLDQAVLKQVCREKVQWEGLSPKERLFEVFMLRFETMHPHRLALANILQDQLRQPLQVWMGGVDLSRSLTWMMEAADLNLRGIRWVMGVKALGLVYLASLRVFLRDDSGDLSVTMAELDKKLDRLNSVVRFFCRATSPCRSSTVNDADDAADGQAATS